MKKLSSLTFRYMKKNWERTGTTLIGIILSVVMIYSIFVCGTGIYESMEKQAYEKNLAWDAVFVCDGETAQKIAYQAEYYGGGKEEDIPSMTHAWMMKVTEQAAAVNDFRAIKAPIVLRKGTFPNGEKGIVLTLSESRSRKVTVGDSVMIADSEGKESKKVVTGVFDENAWYVNIPNIENNPSMHNLILMTEEMYEGDLTVYVVFDDKTDLKGQAEKIASRYGIKNYYVSDTALCYFYAENKTESSAYLLTFVLMLIIASVIGFVLMFIVRNAFNISVYERNNDYGILRCIGLSRRQIIRMILYEAVVLALIGTAVGILLGQILCTFLFRFLKAKLAVDIFMVFRIRNLLITALFMFIVTLYAMVSPIVQLYRLNPIEALCKTNEGKTEKSKKEGKRKGRFFSLFGVEIGYAYKNITRMRGRFAMTVVSLALGSALFIGSSTGIKSIGRWIVNTPEMGGGYDGRFTMDTYTEAAKVKESVEKFSCVDDTQLSSFWCWWRDNVYVYGVSEAAWNELMTIVSSGEQKEGEHVVNVVAMGQAKGKEEDRILMIKDKEVLLHTIGAADEAKAAKILMKYSDYADYESFLAGETYIYQMGGAFEGIDGSENWDIRDGYSMSYVLKTAFRPGESTFSFDDFVDHSLYLYEDYEGASDYRMHMALVKYSTELIICVILLLFLVNITNTQRAQLLLRKNEFFILQTIGMNKKQKRKMIYAETMIMVILGFVFGCALGLLGAYGLNAVFYRIYYLDIGGRIPALSIDGICILIDALLLFGVGWLAAFFSSRKELGRG